MKCLYKYPQAEFPYQRLREENGRRSRLDPEYELIDTGVFGENRYFDVFVEYAKAAPDDIQIRITVFNRGPETATLHVLPTIWFRNTWRWGGGEVEKVEKPELRKGGAGPDRARRSVLRQSPALLQRRARAVVHGQRDQLRGTVGDAQPVAVRQGWHRRTCGAGERQQRQSGGSRHQGCGAPHADSR